jgi:hypothetical protein
MTVDIKPLADRMRATKFRPMPPPVFDSATPTQADVRLAIELFDALDEASKAWYGGAAFRTRLADRLTHG